jgi:hypothetical protein
MVLLSCKIQILGVISASILLLQSTWDPSAKAEIFLFNEEKVADLVCPHLRSRYLRYQCLKFHRHANGAHYLPSVVGLATLFQVELQVEHSNLSLSPKSNLKAE